ncbi:MAG: PIG-L family deacetylase [Limisphaerales bacterium]
MPRLLPRRAHPHLGLSDRNLNEISTQLDTIAQRCREHGIPAPTSFAFPGNAITPNALPILRTNGIQFARRGGAPEHPYEGGRGVAYEPGLDHPLLIPSAGDSRPDWALADFIQAAEKARDGRIAVLQFHGVPDRAHPWVNTPPEKFEAYLDYLVANQYRVIALRDLAKYVDPLKEPRDPMAVIEARKKALAQAAPLKEVRRAPLDVLVIAPHPDDEVIGCAGVMLQALEQKKRVGVVVITSGDGYPALAAVVARKDIAQLTPDDFLQAGALRQRHSLRAMARIGVPQDELLFLGYPDSGLEKIHTGTGSTPIQQVFTKKTATYGVSVTDYHSLVHGRPATYLRANLVADLVEIIRDRQPKEIYVTHEADTHGDHRAAFWLVRDAIRSARHEGDFFTYVVHGAPPPEPPSRRVTLTQRQVDTKRAALQDHQAGTSPIHDKLAAEYTKPEELFWKVRVEPAAAK